MNELPLEGKIKYHNTYIYNGSRHWAQMEAGVAKIYYMGYISHLRLDEKIFVERKLQVSFPNPLISTL